MALSRCPIIVEASFDFICFFLIRPRFMPSSSSVSTTKSQNKLAAILVIIGMTLISSNDAIMKLSGEEMSVGQMLFVRGFFAVILFSVYIKATGRPLWPSQMMNQWNWARATCECCATVCFITSLTLLPIATASTLVWITPILLTIAAAFFLKERVSAGRWLAVTTGFAGVLLVTNPFGDSFSLAMLLPLASAVFVSMRDLMTRKIDKQLESIYVLLITLFVVTVVGFGMTISDWQPVSAGRASWLALSALLLGVGFLLQINAVRIGELSFIAPFSYTGILVAGFWGYMIWHQLPTVFVFAGMGLIVGSGIYLLNTSNANG